MPRQNRLFNEAKEIHANLLAAGERGDAGAFSKFGSGVLRATALNVWERGRRSLFGKREPIMSDKDMQEITEAHMRLL